MARIMTIRTLQSNTEDINRLAQEIDHLDRWGYRGYVTHEMQKVARDMVDQLLAVIMMTGDPSQPSPAILVRLISKNRELRHFLNVNADKIRGPQDYWRDLLDILVPVIANIQLPGDHPWIPKLLMMFGKLGLMGIAG
jgi:hypothetical protein